MIPVSKPSRQQYQPYKEADIGLGQQVHHKFIVSRFNTPKAWGWFGSSNMAQGGEDASGDNLMEANDPDIATVYAIKAFALVDHFAFKNKTDAKGAISKPRSKILTSGDAWTVKYFDLNDLYFQDRMMF